MKSLIVGMGIGKLYQSVLTQLGHEVITVDSDISKMANFPSVDPAIIAHAPFDLVFICTPNFTHQDLAYKLAPFSKIVFVEKPGVVNSKEWTKLVHSFKTTRFMMVKNNMWRNNINDLKDCATKSKYVNIAWIRKNCIPSPGSWFTTKELAFGGVSRDLMPHLLSLYIALNPNWKNDQLMESTAIQQWQLGEIESTEYGTVYPNGVYNVDDSCVFDFADKWNLSANWRSMSVDHSDITFIDHDGNKEVFDLGWCPEEAYLNMISDAIENLNNNEFWINQLEQDEWIHKKIEKL